MPVALKVVPLLFALSVVPATAAHAIGAPPQGDPVTVVEKQPAPASVATPALDRLWMVNAKAGWAESSSGLWRTSNGGRSWRQTLPLHGPVSNVVDIVSANSALVLSSVPPGYRTLVLQRTSDGGRDWGRLAVSGGSSLYQLEPEDLDAVDSATIYALVRTNEGMNSPNGELLETHDGGQKWAIQAAVGVAPSVRSGGRLPSAIGPMAMSGGGVGWLVARSTTTAAPQLFRTTDDAESWVPVALPKTSSGRPLVALAAPDQFETSRQWLLVAGTDVDGVIASTCEVLLSPEAPQGGWRPSGSCEAVLTPSDGVASPFFLTSQLGWEQRRGDILLTTDGASQWRVAGRAPGTNGTQLLAIDFVTRRRGWDLVEGPSSEASLFGTIDGGETWQRV